jgi:microcystin-dependent protein
MATDIKISELNEIATNNNLNHIIVNDRENAGDEGITKKIKLENFLTPNIVKSTNIENGSIISSKIAGLAVDCSKIANNTITCNQIAQCTVNNFVLDSNAVDSRVLNNNCGYTVKCLTVAEGAVNIASGTSGCLDVKSGVTSLNFIKYYWPSTQTAGQFLKTDGSGNLSWAEAVPGEATSLVFSEIMPVGTIVPWAGSGNVPDDKWLECNGQTFIGENYPQLRDALGEIWGPSSGDNYRLPDLRGRVVVGAGTSSSDDNGENRTFTVTDKGGEYNHTLTCNEMPSHVHDVCGQVTDEAGFGTFTRYSRSNSSVFNSKLTSQPVGGGQSHTNVQPYTTTRYIIKAKPDDVEQFNPTLGPGLSASDAGGSTSNITLTSTEIGVKINNDNLTYDTGDAIALKDDISVTNLSASSIQMPDTTPTASADSTLVDTKKQGLAFPFSKYFETTFVQPNASTAAITPIAHGLGGKPTFTYVTLECTGAEKGYNVGDEVPFNSPNNISNNHGPTLFFDDTSFKWRTYGNVYITRYDTSSVFAIDHTKWKWRIKAWR